MMDCPRCGFAQPKDRFCANCGLDVDAFLARPQPLWLRVIQNSNLHLSLIGIFLAVVVFYLLYARSTFLARKVNHMFGTPLSSRDAGDPGRETPTDDGPAMASDLAAAAPANDGADPSPTPASPSDSAANPPAAAAVKEPKRLELSFWEINHNALANLLSGATPAGESQMGRGFLVNDAAKFAEVLQSSGKSLAPPRPLELQTGAQLLIETPPTTNEPFQFGFALQLGRYENREALVRWDSQLVLAQPETPAEMASQVPAMKSVQTATFAGSSTFGAQNGLVLILEPSNRRPREELLQRAGRGPWSIFHSEEFQTEKSDWVLFIDFK